jgi:hypothetical protein
MTNNSLTNLRELVKQTRKSFAQFCENETTAGKQVNQFYIWLGKIEHRMVEDLPQQYYFTIADVNLLSAFCLIIYRFVIGGFIATVTNFPNAWFYVSLMLMCLCVINSYRVEHYISVAKHIHVPDAALLWTEDAKNHLEKAKEESQGQESLQALDDVFSGSRQSADKIREAATDAAILKAIEPFKLQIEQAKGRELKLRMENRHSQLEIRTLRRATDDARLKKNPFDLRFATSNMSLRPRIVNSSQPSS